MSEPRSIRFPESTLKKLTLYAATQPGLTSSSVAALLVEEGLRMHDHPGIVFRDSPTGRRAVIEGGPDIWEIVRALRQVRTATPLLTREEVTSFVAKQAAITESAIRTAVAYYSEYPTEIEGLEASSLAAENALEKRLAAERELLGA